MHVLEVLSRAGGVASIAHLAEHGCAAAEVTRAVRLGAVLRMRRGWVALPSAPDAVVAAVRIGGSLSCTALRHAVACQGRDDAVGSLDSALDKELIRPSHLHDALVPLPRSYRTLLDLADGSADSGVETKARLGLRAGNIACRAQVPIPGVGNVDLLVGERLVIELDGEEWHSGSEAFAEDRRRDLLLAALGYRVLRLTYNQVMHQWPAVLATVRGLIAARETGPLGRGSPGRVQGRAGAASGGRRVRRGGGSRRRGGRGRAGGVRR